MTKLSRTLSIALLTITASLCWSQTSLTEIKGVDTGATPVGQFSTFHSVLLFNNTTTDNKIMNLVPGANVQFSGKASKTACYVGAVLPPGGTCQLFVSLRPSQGGAVADTLTVWFRHNALVLYVVGWGALGL